MIADESRPAHLGIRVDHDAAPDRWRVDCRDCGAPLAGGVDSLDVAAVVLGAERHLCARPSPAERLAAPHPAVLRQHPGGVRPT